MGAEITVISWRDIPAQVVASSGRKKARAQLSPRFQEAIDMAATKVGLTGTDEYLQQWHSGTRREQGGDLTAVAEAEAARIEDAFTEDVLTDLILKGGFADEDRG